MNSQLLQKKYFEDINKNIIKYNSSKIIRIIYSFFHFFLQAISKCNLYLIMNYINLYEFN